MTLLPIPKGVTVTADYCNNPFNHLLIQHLLITVCTVSGGYDVVCADECPPAAGQWRLTRVHDGRHPGVLVHAGVGAVDYPTAPTVGSAAH